MFRLPNLVSKAGQFTESKHRRGQPKNRGQFASGGGGGGSGAAHHISQGSSAPGKPGGGILASPLFSGALDQPAEPKPGEPKPPPLPTAFRAGGAFRPPGTGKPPKNLGQPKSTDEARDQMIWLLGRASILRRQGREKGPLDVREQKELLLSINLAGRLSNGHFTLPQVAKTEPKKKPEAPAAKPEEKKPGLVGGTEAGWMNEPAVTPPKPQDSRANPTLEAAFAEPTPEKPKPTGDIRANPLLESLFGESKPAAKPAAPASEPAARPEGDATHGVKLPRERSKLTVQHAARAVSEMGYTLGPGKHHLASKTTTYELTHHDGSKTTVSAEQLREMVYRGKKKTPRKPGAKSFRLPSIVYKALWEEHKHPREHLGHFASKLKEHIGGLTGHPDEHAHADQWVAHLNRLTQAEVHHVATHAGIEGHRPSDPKHALIQRIRNRLTALARARERAEV